MLRDRLQRSIGPRAVVALSRMRMPRPWTRTVVVELYFAFDDPYAAVGLPGLLFLTRERGLELEIFPLVERGIPGDPAADKRQAYAIVDADRLADFNNAPVMTSNARNKGARKHFKAAYYDTPERTLWRNGLTLRVRQSGARFTQTVKTERGDDPLRRGEWEASVTSMMPDLALAMPFIPEKIRSDLHAQALEPVFTTDIRRHQRMVDMPSGTVEVAFDHGMLKAGPRTLPVSEIEIELKQGNASAIYELALRLA